MIRRENKYGVMKDYLEISIGTSRVIVPRHIRNPTTGRRHDLTKLSDSGYLKRFLALYWHFSERKDGVIDLDYAPVMSFGREWWELRELNDYFLAVKREPSSRFEEMVLCD